MLVKFTTVLQFGTKKLLASKPGTASETLNLVKNRTTFFLQEGALLKVSNIIEKDFKLRFVAKAKVLLGSSGNSRDFTLPKDFNYLNEIAKLMDDQVLISPTFYVQLFCTVCVVKNTDTTIFCMFHW